MMGVYVTQEFGANHLPHLGNIRAFVRHGSSRAGMSLVSGVIC